MATQIRWAGFAVALLALLFATAMPALATDRSHNVVIIGGSVLDNNIDCANSSSAANSAGRTGGGCLSIKRTAAGEFAPLGDFSMFSFTAMTPASVAAADLTIFDTAVLNVASTAMACNTGNLTAAGQAKLVNFVASGKKLIIYDPECTSPHPNYSWLPYPFTTNNPGAMGATGTVNIVEENTLSSANPASSYYINAAHLGSATDAVGDMNVMTTYDANWKLDMSGTNVNHVTGPVHTYAVYPPNTDVGLIIYNGFDQDYQSLGYHNPELRKIWFLELYQPFNPSGLAGSVSVTGIQVAPVMAYNPPGRPHTVTATAKDLLGAPRPGVAIDFSVTGVNAGMNGTGTTDASGQAAFTYNSVVEGTDTIAACVHGAVPALCANATKIWTAKCDVDSNLKINIDDINLIMSNLNRLATGPGDPRDVDGDGRITVLDARKCTLRCDKPACAR